MKEIQLTKGYVAIIDDRDYKAVSKKTWYAQVMKHGVYAVGDRRKRVNGKRVGLFEYMHSFIAGIAPKGMVVDHKNRNTLDNRRSNLRIVTFKFNVVDNAVFLNKTNKFGFANVDRSTYTRKDGTKSTYYVGRVYSMGKKYFTKCYRTPEEAFNDIPELRKKILTIESQTKNKS